jgi:hypothetical protein
MNDKKTDTTPKSPETEEVKDNSNLPGNHTQNLDQQRNRYHKGSIDQQQLPHGGR